MWIILLFSRFSLVDLICLWYSILLPHQVACHPQNVASFHTQEEYRSIVIYHSYYSGICWHFIPLSVIMWCDFSPPLYSAIVISVLLPPLLTIYLFAKFLSFSRGNRNNSKSFLCIFPLQWRPAAAIVSKTLSFSPL